MTPFWKNNIFVVFIAHFLHFFIFQEPKVIFTNFMTSSNFEITNVTGVIYKNHKNEVALNLTVDSIVEITNMTGVVKFAVNKTESDQNYGRILVSSSVNVCKMLQGITGNILTKMIMQEFQRCADFELKCPVPKVY